MFSSKYCEIVKINVLYRAPLMAASGFLTNVLKTTLKKIIPGKSFSQKLFRSYFLIFATAFLKMFFSKSFILDVWPSSNYASGVVNYCRQKLHLKSLVGPLICLCMYWVWQFLNETSKICYEETQKNGKKHVPFVPRNSCSKILVNFWFWIANYQLGSL